MERQPIALALLVLVVLTTALYVGAIGPASSPPPVVAASAGEMEFSAERARVHLREITRAPSPVGSAEHARVRGYLLDALRELGLEPEVHRTTAMRSFAGAFRAASVQNIIARLPGADPTRAIVLMAHYDTVPHAPGATDAGNGVAAILETVRALQSGSQLSNDVIILITDAEEVGLLGAQAFVDEHPWAEDVGIVLNAEGRGHAGSVIMFRTTGQNGRMIRTLAATAKRPFASSLTDNVFQHMPNDTDLSVFAEAGIPGMDFANGHGITHYHTPLDSYEEADARSLQHHGSYMLNLARAFGEQDLTALSAPSRVYFSLPVIGLVHYPINWAMPLAVLLVLLAAGILLWGFISGRLRGKGVLLGVAPFLALVIGLPLLAHFGWSVLSGLLPEPAWFWHGSPYNSSFYLLSFCALAAAVFVVIIFFLCRWMRSVELLAGALLVWMVLALVTAVFLPGGSYLFVWPVLFAAGGMAYWWVERPEALFRRATVLGFMGIPVLLIVAPQIEIIEVMLTIQMLALPVALVVLILGMLALQIDLLIRGFRWGLPRGLAAIGLVALLGGLLTSGFDADRKKPTGVNYLAEVTEDEAYWYSIDPEVDEWTARFLGEDPERQDLPAWGRQTRFFPAPTPMLREAPLLRTDAPTAEVLADSLAASGRHIRMHIQSPPETFQTSVMLLDGTLLQNIRISGRTVPAPSASQDSASGSELLRHFGPPEEGFELSFTAPADEPVRLRLRAVIPGIPALEGQDVPPRPDHTMAGAFESEMTYLHRTIEVTPESEIAGH